MNKKPTMYIMCHTMFQPCTKPIYINHVHEYHTIYHKISSMGCINHMPKTCANYVPTICLYQHANHVPQKSFISLMNCLYHEPCIATINISTNHLNYIIPYIMYQIKCINQCTKYVPIIHEL
jgi:hypothetical protein